MASPEPSVLTRTALYRLVTPLRQLHEAASDIVMRLRAQPVAPLGAEAQPVRSPPRCHRRCIGHRNREGHNVAVQLLRALIAETWPLR
jgi:hypothetical protein